MKKNYKKRKKENFLFSIICATVGMNTGLDRLCKSLSSQIYKNFELIICDQNNHLLNKKIIDKYNNIKIKFIKSRKGLSIARNKGIDSSIGDYLIFLDDDIKLNKYYLFKINKILENKKHDIIAYKVVNNNKSLLRYPKVNRYLSTTYEIFNSISSVSFVINSKKKLYFNKNLGLGSKNIYQSGEETDFLLNAKRKFNYKIFFTTSIEINHKSKNISLLHALKKSFLYGCGWGYVVKRNNLNYGFILSNFLKIFLNIIYHFLTLNFKKMLISILTLAGRLFSFAK